jgi:CubicO group peptidase (beta-lactamase class C family)
MLDKLPSRERHVVRVLEDAVRRGRWVLASGLAVLAVAGPLPAVAAGHAVTRLDGSKISSAEIDAEVARMMQVGAVSGLGVAILNNRRVVYLKAYGYRDTTTRQPLTINSTMTAASFTKSTLAYAAMQMVEEGLLDLDAPVQKYLKQPLPTYKDYELLANDERYKRLTIRMLLDHTTGFDNLRRLNNGKVEIKFEPGSRYAYSGEGIRLLQLIIEEVTGKPLNDTLRTRIFEPFKMRRTNMTWKDEFESDHATPHDRQNKPRMLRKRLTADAAGSMQTSISDFSRFIEGVMRGKGLKPATREEMFKPQIEIFSRRQFPTMSTETTDANRAIRLSYGLGWGLFFTPVGKAVFKEGHDDGWQHYTVMFDDAGSGIVLMSNSDNAEAVFPGLLETLLGNRWTPVEWEGYASVP